MNSGLVAGLFKTIKTTYPSYVNENHFFDSSRQ
jgi:hypothetical protein